MFARKVSMHLKARSRVHPTLEREVLPLLSKTERIPGRKSRLSHREERKHLASVCGTRQESGKLQPRSLRRSGEGLGGS